MREGFDLFGISSLSVDGGGGGCGHTLLISNHGKKGLLKALRVRLLDGFSVNQ